MLDPFLGRLGRLDRLKNSVDVTSGYTLTKRSGAVTAFDRF